MKEHLSPLFTVPSFKKKCRVLVKWILHNMGPECQTGYHFTQSPLLKLPLFRFDAAFAINPGQSCTVIIDSHVPGLQ